MSDPAAVPVKVLFILGKGRSGSTLLDNVLGQVPGVFSTGELHRLWDWGLRQGVPCGCGKDALTCPVWSPVLAKSVGIQSRDGDAERIEAIWHDQQAVERWRQAPRLFTRRQSGGWLALRRYAEILGSVYGALRDVTGARLLVDSSKTPLNPAVLGLVEGLDGSAVQLVRDPRAVGFSWQRTRAWSDRARGGTMPRFGPVHTAASWALRNVTAELVLHRWPATRTARLCYEDFCEAPRTTITELLALAGVQADRLPFSDEHTVRVGETHTIGGNPNRVTNGEVSISPDREWENQLPARTQRVVSTLTWPLARRYGYSASRGAPSR